jgi:predicted nucleic acid-binding Zn ribbon protein
VLVHEIADRLDPRPAGRRVAEAAPGEGEKLAVDLAVAARQQELQRRRRQLGRVVLARLDVDVVEPARIADLRFVARRTVPLPSGTLTRPQWLP